MKEARTHFAVELLSAVGSYSGPPVVDSVSLNIEYGERVVVMGLNGSGKSTLLRLIAGLISTREGEVITLGKRVGGARDLSALRREGVVYVPQRRNVFENLSVEENILVAVRLLPRSHSLEAVRFARTLLAGLDARWTAPAGLLSGGQKQLLAATMGIVARPRLLLMDEPTAGLSMLAQESVLLACRDLADSIGATIVIAEQRQSLLKNLASRVLVLRGGRVVMDRTYPVPDADLATAMVGPLAVT